MGDTEVLIDGGNRSPGVTGYLEKYVDGSLETMIATHPHADHIGGLIAVLNTFDVEQIWLNGDTPKSKTYLDFMKNVNAEDAKVKEARRGDAIMVDGLTLNVLHPVEPLVANINDNSIVLMLSYGDIDFLFMGDAEKKAEAEMIADGVLTDIEILKVGHHGSRTSSSQAFLNIIQPEVLIISAGISNDYYRQPDSKMMHWMRLVGAVAYRTDSSGSIMVTTDGETYRVATEK